MTLRITSRNQVPQEQISLKVFLENIGFDSLPNSEGGEEEANPKLDELVGLVKAKIEESTFSDRKGDFERVFDAFKETGEIPRELLSQPDFQRLLHESIISSLDEVLKDGDFQVQMGEKAVRAEALSVFERDSDARAKIIAEREKLQSEKLKEFFTGVIPRIKGSVVNFALETFHSKGANFIDPNKQLGQLLSAGIGLGAAYTTQRSGVDLGVLSNIAIATLVATLLLAVQDFDKKEKWHQVVLAFTGAFSISHLISVAGFQAGADVTIADISPVDFIRMIQAQGGAAIETAKQITMERQADSSDAFVGYVAPVTAMVLTFGAYYGTGQMSRNARDYIFSLTPMHGLVSPLTSFLKNNLKEHALVDQLQRAVTGLDPKGVWECFAEIDLLVEEEGSLELSELKNEVLIKVVEYLENPSGIFDESEESGHRKKQRQLLA